HLRHLRGTRATRRAERAAEVRGALLEAAPPRQHPRPPAAAALALPQVLAELTGGVEGFERLTDTILKRAKVSAGDFSHGRSDRSFSPPGSGGGSITQGRAGTDTRGSMDSAGRARRSTRSGPGRCVCRRSHAHRP